jgi:hypothetical protein
MKSYCPICKKVIDEVEFMQYQGSCINCAIEIENSISDKNYENKAISQIHNSDL